MSFLKPEIRGRGLRSLARAAGFLLFLAGCSGADNTIAENNERVVLAPLPPKTDIDRVSELLATEQLGSLVLHYYKGGVEIVVASQGSIVDGVSIAAVFCVGNQIARYIPTPEAHLNDLVPSNVQSDYAALLPNLQTSLCADMKIEPGEISAQRTRS